MLRSSLVSRLINLALEEDQALNDVTATLTVPELHRSLAIVVARERLVVCGLEIIGRIAEQAGFAFQVSLKAQEGSEVGPEAVLAEITGLTRELLAAERTILNFLQRLCGVATHTRHFVAQVSGLVVLDTRKTMPGWRVLDKYATSVGGARNHRMSLGDMILVKNNHIDAHPGGMRAALESVRAQKPDGMRWEVEVRNLDELTVALEFSPDVIMLDNFSDEAIRDAMATLGASQSRPLIEVSGGVRSDRLRTLQSLGVDAVSAGALTTQAPNVDISMRISATAHES